MADPPSVIGWSYRIQNTRVENTWDVARESAATVLLILIRLGSFWSILQLGAVGLSAFPDYQMLDCIEYIYIYE